MAYATAFHEDADVWAQISVFVGPASDWADYPNKRRDYEWAIVGEARELLDAGGLSVA